MAGRQSGLPAIRNELCRPTNANIGKGHKMTNKIRVTVWLENYRNGQSVYVVRLGKKQTGRELGHYDVNPDCQKSIDRACYWILADGYRQAWQTVYNV